MPIPAIIGGAVALGTIASNLYTANKDLQSKREGRKYLRGAAADVDNEYAGILRDIDSYYDNRKGLGKAEDVTDYRKAIEGYDPNSFAYTPEKTFDQTYGKTRDDFINPYYQQIIDDTAATVQHSAAGAGLGRGSGAAASIADAIVKKNEELYKDAQSMFESDRNFEYGKYNDYITMMQNNLDRKRAATDTKLQLQGNLANDYFSVMDARQADRMAAQQDRMAAANAYNTAMAGLY
jgi:hypothetical protein